MNHRKQEQEARAYVEGLQLDPDEVVKGYYDTGNGTMAWGESPRWCWYKGANLAWDQPLSGYQRALLQREIALEQAMARGRQAPTR